MTILTQLFVMFFRIGLFSFGGGYVMLPLIYQGIQDFGFLSAAEFSDLVALSQVTPGPIAVNAATYVGYQSAGVLGATAATIGVSLPSFLLVILVVHFLGKFRESKGLQAVLAGIRPATVGLLASAVIFLAQTSILIPDTTLSQLASHPAQSVQGISFLFFVLFLVIYAKWKIDPIKLTLLAGVLGALLIR